MIQNDANDANDKKSFWKSTMGFITKITVFLTTITALALAIKEFNKNVVVPVTGSDNSVVYHQGVETATSIDSTTNKGASYNEPEIPPLPKKPNISIISFDFQPKEMELDEGNKPKEITVTGTVYNDGEAIATNCVFKIEVNTGVLSGVSSENFPLDPKERKDITLHPTISTSAKIKAILTSDNDSPKESKEQDIVIWNYKTLHTNSIYNRPKN